MLFIDSPNHQNPNPTKMLSLQAKKEMIAVVCTITMRSLAGKMDKPRFSS
ncbi:hypothetical protein BTHERMOSOX_909 [Bathymodiolus thermophilus thioautotrophic gill symbiont]|nr:hypothetical protein BTHERMOSOX_909 [Bathymodiolus thermophilus thioautotrophic gill symbiont]